MEQGNDTERGHPGVLRLVFIAESNLHLFSWPPLLKLSCSESGMQSVIVVLLYMIRLPKRVC